MDVVSGCDQWVVDIRTSYLIVKHHYSCAFWEPHPYLHFNFFELFFILVFVHFLDS